MNSVGRGWLFGEFQSWGRVQCQNKAKTTGCIELDIGVSPTVLTMVYGLNPHGNVVSWTIIAVEMQGIRFLDKGPKYLTEVTEIYMPPLVQWSRLLEKPHTDDFRSYGQSNEQWPAEFCSVLSEAPWSGDEADGSTTATCAMPYAMTLCHEDDDKLLACFEDAHPDVHLSSLSLGK